MNIIITGSRTGIGRAITEEMLNRGHSVFGCSRGNSDLQHPDYTHFELDVADENAVKQLFDAFKRKHKELDVLINNAGTASMNHLLLTPANTVKQIFETNFVGTFIFCREAGKIMSRQNHGRIINMSSVASALHLPGESVYAASKAAVENFSVTAAKELSSFNITVNTIGPGPVKTALTQNIGDEKLTKVAEQLITQKRTQIADIVNIIDFLIDEKSEQITGQHFYIGGV
ncbi:SDR family NAD(P)-dependent oxidoreductase [bacterium]|nr:SDR family NAD(P)-dependent oxidoreductase [bacterium]